VSFAVGSQTVELTVTDDDDNDSENVTLDGSGSSDSDGTIVSYEWWNAPRNLIQVL
jgi:hypothetical protein